MKFEVFDAFHQMSTLEVEALVDFLHLHLGKYGDSKSAIRKALEYAGKDRSAYGGLVVTARDEASNDLIGAVVINKTGMEEYIPENILVYIATHAEHRGKGIGKQLIEQVLDKVKGGIALHVEEDNPAKRLYERMGFTNPYLEMRLNR